MAVYDLIVVGGGPAGMLGAATAGKTGLKVLLLEKNDRPGRKLSLTGNGRCNVTNYGDDEDFINHVVTNPRFLYSSMRAFNNRDLIALLDSLGVKTKVEPGNRVFPVSGGAAAVVGALRKHLSDCGVELRLNAGAKQVLARDNRVCGVLLDDGKRIESGMVLLATGGMSYPQTGSTGDGYAMARRLGHTIVQPRPALVPLVTREHWVKDLQGVALRNVKVRAMVDNRVRVEQAGDVLFTHFGVSGPVILTTSSYLNKLPAREVKLTLDLLPVWPVEQLDRRLREYFHAGSGKLLKNALDDLLPRRLIPVLLDLCGVDACKQVDQVTRQEREQLVRGIKNMVLTVEGTRPLKEAIVTSGGVDTREINPSTLESKIIKGLYFAGEIIDVDALTGGYNLQIAFSTGYLSGLGAAGAKSGLR